MSQNRLSQSPTEKIVETVNTHGLQKAARRYGTSASTLSRWLKTQNYKRRSVYVKAEKTS